MSKSSYTPIDCNYYDELEALATLQTKCVIQYLDTEGQSATIEGIIKDFRTKNKEEFMQLDNGTEIRLDQLVSVNGKAL